jgi:lipid II:glycine glycyltransferase (peptidoglycan interpeptide bridge formation enzyme)
MELRNITAAELSKFILEYPPSGGLFLQTPAWAKLENNSGGQTDFLGLYEGDFLVGIASIIFRKLPGGFKYIYISRGPVVKEKKCLKLFLELLVKYYKDKGFLFLRVEPVWHSHELHIENNDFGEKDFGFKKVSDVQPRATVILDLTHPEERLLSAMHEKTRYNIRLALKKGLETSLIGREGLADFWNLLKTTAGRDGFATHPKSHYEALLVNFGAEPLVQGELAVRLVEVRWQGKLLASNMLAFSNGVVTYLHGASSNEHRELMPTYFLHWRTIQQAQGLNFKFYDLWGVAPSDGSKSSWQGITRFKLGWGGKRVEYSGTFDFPYKNTTYYLYRLVNKLRRLF